MINKDNHELAWCLNHYRFTKAKEYLDRESIDVIGSVNALAETFGDIGYRKDSTHKIVKLCAIALLHA